MIVTGLVILLIVVLLTGSLHSFLYHKSYQRSYFSLELFYTLIVVYFAVMIGFGLLYFVLSFHGVVLIEGDSLSHIHPFEALAHSLYFSGVTLMTVGYGDIVPSGAGRILALTEAMIGYVLPAAFFLKVWQSSSTDKEPERAGDNKEGNY